MTRPAAEVGPRETGRPALDLRPGRGGPVFHGVALGMTVYARAAFRFRILGAERLSLPPGTLLVSTHQSDHDVPILCSSLYFGARLWRPATPRPGFAVRDDLFLRGFFAGYPPDLPLRARRALYRIGVGPALAAWASCLPLRPANRMRLVEIFRARPDAPLEELLTRTLGEPFRERARELGRPVPRRARDVLFGGYADLLWRVVGPDDLTADLGELWARRATDAVADFRTMVDFVRRGGRLVIFPEGSPSPDGAVGPLQRGLGALVRRARPTLIQPAALAYDPLVTGRRRVYCAFGEAFAPPAENAEATVLAALRRTTPLVCGQVAADFAGRAGRVPWPDELERALVEAVEAARGEGRPLDPNLGDAAGRTRLAAEALDALRECGTDDDRLLRLARTYESARTPAA